MPMPMDKQFFISGRTFVNLTEKYIVSHKTSYFPASIDWIPFPEYELQLILRFLRSALVHGTSFKNIVDKEIVIDEVRGFQ